MPSTKAGRRYLLITLFQFVLVAMFLVYALVQRTQAIKSREEAVMNENEAMEQKMLAEKIAIEAQRALEECQKSK